MRNFFYLLTFLVLLFGITLSSNSVYATSEVWLSGSTWIAETDGNQVYSGGSFFDAVNAACWNEGSGTINIWNSGNSGPGESDIYAIWPESNQTLDFHGNTIHCNGNDLVVAIRADGKSNITVKDVNVTGWPRYGFWFTGCSNVTFTDITMDISSGLGIRYSGRDSYASNLTINGNVDIHSVGHAIETYTVDGIDMGTVTVRSDNGCGVLLNDSENATIDAIYAYDCNYGGSYAGFRQANSNGTTWVGYLYARHCGRGFYSVSGSNNCTVEEVNIADCSTSGASVSNSSHDVYINSGTITSSNKNVDIWNDAWNVCMKVNGSSYGDNCSTGGGESYVQFQNRGTGLRLDGLGRTTNGHACGQYANTNHQNSHWELVDAGSGYYQLRNRGTGLYLDGMGRTTNGDDVGQYANTTHQNSHWSLQQYSGSYYRLQNRGTGLYLDGMGRTGNGDAVGQWASSGSHNAQWQMIPVSGSAIASSSFNDEQKVTKYKALKEAQVYPNPASDVLKVSFPSDFENVAKARLIDAAGKVVQESSISNASSELDIASVSPGFYILIIDDGVNVVKQKVMIE